MADAALAADVAPVDSGAALIDTPNFSQPLGSQIPDEAQAKPPSIDDALDRAFEKVGKAEKPEPKVAEKSSTKPQVVEKTTEKPVDKVETKAEKPADSKLVDRAPDGKFLPKEKLVDEANKPAEVKPSFTASEAPSRFSPDAKAEWATAPESVRAETERAIRELTEGHQKYKADAEEFHKVREFHDMARQAGKELPSVIREYVNMENMLANDPAKGMEVLLNKLGTSPRQYAEMVLGQPADQQQGAQERTILELRQQNEQLVQRISRIEGNIEQQEFRSLQAEISGVQKEMPRYEELRTVMAQLMNAGLVPDGPTTEIVRVAYEMAERLNPVPKAPDLELPAASSAPDIDLSAQTQKGSKSINGAPSAGSSPAAKKRVMSIDEALDRAFSR